MNICHEKPSASGIGAKQSEASIHHGFNHLHKDPSRITSSHFRPPAPTSADDPDEDTLSVVFPEYELPDDLDKFTGMLASMTDEFLMDRIERLSLHDHPVRKELRPYEGPVRSFLLACCLELNRRGLYAPRFRKLRRPSYKPDTVAERLLGLDRQVIDLHWLHCRGIKPNITNNHFITLLSSPKFDFKLAGEFATARNSNNRPISTDAKSKWLALPDDEAWQLATIQTKAMGNAAHYMVKGRRNRDGVLTHTGCDQVRQRLKNSTANEPHLRPYVEEWVTLWRCWRMVGDSPTRLARLEALASGRTKPLDRATIRSKLATVLDRLDREVPH